MYCLEVIKKINSRKGAGQFRKQAHAGARPSSFCLSRGGVVLHSASLRSTGFLNARRRPAFLRGIKKAGRGVWQRSRFIDLYFPPHSRD